MADVDCLGLKSIWKTWWKNMDGNGLILEFWQESGWSQAAKFVSVFVFWFDLEFIHKSLRGPKGDLKYWLWTTRLWKFELNPVIFSRMTYFLWGFRIPWDSVGFDGHASSKFHQRNLLPEPLLSPMSSSPERLQGAKPKLSSSKSIRNMKNTSKDFNSDHSKWSHSKTQPKNKYVAMLKIYFQAFRMRTSPCLIHQVWQTPFYRVKSRVWFPNHNCPSHPFLHL